MSDHASSAPVSTQWSLPARYVVGVLLLLLAVLGVLFILPLLHVLFLTFLISFLLFIPARALVRRTRLPYPVIIVLFFLLILGLLIYGLVTAIPTIHNAFLEMWTAVQNGYDDLAAQLSAAKPVDGLINVAGIQVDIGALLPVLKQLIIGRTVASTSGALNFNQIAGVLGQLAGNIVGITGSVFNSMAGLITMFITALIISFFLLIDLPVSGGILTDWVPPQYSREITSLLARLDRLWLNFFKAEVVIGFIIGAGSLVIFLVLGVRFALPLAVIIGTIGLIPTIGGILAVIPVVIVCLFLGSTSITSLDHVTFALLVVVAYLIYSQIIYTFISPRISGTAVQLPAVAVIVGVLAALAVFGVLGALLVVPIMGSVRLFLHFALSKLALRDPYPDEAAPPTEIPGFFSQMLYVKSPIKRRRR